MSNDINSWEIYDKSINTNIIELLREIKSAQDDNNKILEECKSILNETKTLQSNIVNNIKQNEINLNQEVEKKVVRESNRIWRMYGNNYKPIVPFLNVNKKVINET